MQGDLLTIAQAAALDESHMAASVPALEDKLSCTAMLLVNNQKKHTCTCTPTIFSYMKNHYF